MKDFTVVLTMFIKIPEKVMLYNAFDQKIYIIQHIRSR